MDRDLGTPGEVSVVGQRDSTVIGSLRKARCWAYPCHSGRPRCRRRVEWSFARVLYLPRLAGPKVLTEAIERGVGLLTWEADVYAVANRYNSGPAEREAGGAGCEPDRRGGRRASGGAGRIRGRGDAGDPRRAARGRVRAGGARGYREQQDAEVREPRVRGKLSRERGGLLVCASRGFVAGLPVGARWRRHV